MYTEYNADEKVSATYDQDLLWTRKTIEQSIASTALLNEVRIELELLDVKDRTGPMTLKILMDKQVHHTQATRSAIKQHWLYHMCITDYTGGNVTQFTADWRHLESYFLSLGDNISDSCRQYFKALTDCPNAAFRQHFNTLETTNDPKLQQTNLLFQEALDVYRKLVSDGKWNVRSKKEHNAFLQKKKSSDPKGKSYHSKSTLPPKDPKAHATSKTHDGQGHPIDRTPPKTGEPSTRVNPLTKKDEHFCNDPHCKRWGNHDTDGHEAWYKKLCEARERKKRGNNSDSDTTTSSNNNRSQSPIQVQIP